MNEVKQPFVYLKNTTKTINISIKILRNETVFFTLPDNSLGIEIYKQLNTMQCGPYGKLLLLDCNYKKINIHKKLKDQTIQYTSLRAVLSSPHLPIDNKNNPIQPTFSDVPENIWELLKESLICKNRIIILKKCFFNDILSLIMGFYKTNDIQYFEYIQKNLAKSEGYYGLVPDYSGYSQSVGYEEWLERFNGIYLECT